MSLWKNAEHRGGGPATPIKRRELVPALLQEWRANGLRWERVARAARNAGIKTWNPALYAFSEYTEFLKKYPPRTGALLVLGLNPGPHGMAQTGISFTDCRTASEILGKKICIPGHAPKDLVRLLRKKSGRWRSTYERSSLGVYRFLRLGWGDVRKAYQNVFVANTCPLLFLTPSGKNLTPAHGPLRRLGGLQELRRLAVARFYELLHPRGIICLGSDVEEILGPTAEALVGRERVIISKHPARAVPILWAKRLVRQLKENNLL